MDFSNLPPNMAMKVKNILDSARGDGLKEAQGQIGKVKITIKRTPTLHIVKSEKVGELLWIAENKTKVKKGDIIAKIKFLEITDDVISPLSGFIQEVFVSPGDKVEYGTKLLSIDGILEKSEEVPEKEESFEEYL